jgi:hypothetical protein
MGQGVIAMFGKSRGAEEWWETVLTSLPGYADNTVYDMLTNFMSTTKKGGETAQQMAIRVADEKATKDINVGLETRYKEAEKQDSLLVKQGLAPIYVNKIANNDLNNIDIAKAMIDNLATSNDITKESAERLKNNLKYVPKVPNDFLKLVKEKQKSLISIGEEGLEQLRSLDDLYGKVDSKLNNNTVPKSDVGSLVLTSKNGDEYLVLIALTKYPTTTRDVLDTIVKNGNIVWVDPKFDDLDTSTKREYNNLSTFVEKI